MGADFCITPLDVLMDEDASQEFIVTPTKVAEDLKKTLIDQSSVRGLSFSLDDRLREPIRSYLEIVSLARRIEKDYLIYGYMEKNRDVLTIKVSLFDTKNQEVIQDFYSMDPVEDYDLMIEILGKKILRYLYEKMGYDDQGETKSVKRRVLYLSGDGGIWMAQGDPWEGALSGLFNIHSSLNYVHKQPEEGYGLSSPFWGIGLSLGYSFGLNDSGIDPFFLSILTFGIPLSTGFHWGPSQTLWLSIQPQINLDILSRHSRYENQINETYLIEGLATRFNYDLHLTQRLSLRCGIGYHFDLYDQFRGRLFTTLGVSFLLHANKDKENE